MCYRYVWFTNAAGSPTSSFATQHHDLHRTRRSALNPFFSKQSVTRLEPLIHQKAELICRGLKLQLEKRTPFEFGAAYMSFALDTVSHYAFGESECWNCLAANDFSAEWKEAIIESFEKATLVRYFPWITLLLLKVPHQWIMNIDKSMGMYFKLLAVCFSHFLYLTDCSYLDRGPKTLCYVSWPQKRLMKSVRRRPYSRNYEMANSHTPRKSLSVSWMKVTS